MEMEITQDTLLSDIHSDIMSTRLKNTLMNQFEMKCVGDLAIFSLDMMDNVDGVGAKQKIELQDFCEEHDIKIAETAEDVDPNACPISMDNTPSDITEGLLDDEDTGIIPPPTVVERKIVKEVVTEELRSIRPVTDNPPPKKDPQSEERLVNIQINMKLNETINLLEGIYKAHEFICATPEKQIRKDIMIEDLIGYLQMKLPEFPLS